MSSLSLVQPEVIQTFRRFTRVRLALFLFGVLVYMIASGGALLDRLGVLLVMLLEVALLLAYLSLPRLEMHLRRFYLPIGILWATLGPMIQTHVFLLMLFGQPFERYVPVLILQPVLVMFIPLVVTAWQYTPRIVGLYCAFTFLFDGLLAWTTYALSGPSVATTLFLPPVMAMSLTRMILFFFVGNLIAYLARMQREQSQRLVEANERLAQHAATVEQLSTSRERNRVARELHDVLAHTMSGVAVELEGVRAMLRIDPDRAEALLGQSLRAVRLGLIETRRALQALRASPLEDLGLALAVQHMTESITARAGLQTEVLIDRDIPDYPLEVQQAFYRVAQEALTNIVTHAQAARVRVCLEHEETALRLAICDDGIGFDEQGMDMNQKYGLLGIRERVEMIQGSLTITSRAGQGTEVVLRYDPGDKGSRNGS